MSASTLSTAFEAALFASAGEGTVSPEECLARTRQVAREMLESRGYQDVVQTGNDKLVGSHSNRGRPDTLVLFLQEVKASVKVVREVLEHLSSTDTGKEIVLVSVHGSTTTKNENAHDNIRHLTYRFLMNNVTRHCLVPAHSFVPEDEADVIAASFSSTPSQFPKLLATDYDTLMNGMNLIHMSQDKKKIEEQTRAEALASYTKWQNPNSLPLMMKYMQKLKE